MIRKKIINGIFANRFQTLETLEDQQLLFFVVWEPIGVLSIDGTSIPLILYFDIVGNLVHVEGRLGSHLVQELRCEVNVRGKHQQKPKVKQGFRFRTFGGIKSCWFK